VSIERDLEGQFMLYVPWKDVEGFFLIILKFFVLDGEECGKYKKWIQSKYDATIEYFFLIGIFF
jgi:hypothetical protein